jgi:hypothetical protein
MKTGNRVGAIVTGGARSKTHCHDNFGYYARKLLIQWSAFHGNVGLLGALMLRCVRRYGVR